MSKNQRDLSAWFDYINRIHYTSLDLSLDRIREVAKRADLLQWSIPVVTVTGTNGKGSTVKALEAIYTKAGYRPGAFTSPHLLNYNERISVQEKMCDDEMIINAFEHIDSVRDDISLTFFEYSLLAALYIFKQKQIDILILEVGLGGELDATNIIDADIAVITSIDIDHAAFLGNTRESVAKAKAGIMREGKVLVCGECDVPASLYEAIARLRVTADFIQKDFFLCGNSYPIKQENAACAKRVVFLLQQVLSVPDDIVEEALSSLVMPGRVQLQKVADRDCVFDVAHNRASAAYLAQALSERKKRAAVFSCLSTKDVKTIVAPLMSKMDAWFCAGLEIGSGIHQGHGLSKEKVAEQVLTTGAQVCYTFDHVADAVQAALASDDFDEVVIFGSFYTVSEAMRYCDMIGEGA